MIGLLLGTALAAAAPAAVLATKEKGKILTEALVETIHSDIEELRKASPKQD